mgnify:CR=1 FL=1
MSASKVAGSNPGLQDVPALDWGLENAISQLRNLREASLAARQRLGSPVTLPSRKVLASIIDRVSTALFPNRLGNRKMRPENIDNFVGNILDAACRELYEQSLLELEFNEVDADAFEQQRSLRAEEIVRRFVTRLPRVRELLETDLQAVFAGDPAATSIDEVLVCYPGISALIHYRLGHELHRLGLPLIARIISEIAHGLTGIEIHPAAQISEGCFIDHGNGIAIGETAVIGKRVQLHRGVTLTAPRATSSVKSASDRTVRRHPLIEDGVVIYAGASLLGPITIGRDSVIGSNVWVGQDIPPNSVISQATFVRDIFHEGAGI